MDAEPAAQGFAVYLFRLKQDTGVGRHPVPLAAQAPEQGRQQHVLPVLFYQELTGQEEAPPALTAADMQTGLVVGEVPQADRHGRER